MWRAMLGHRSRWPEQLIGGMLLYAAVIGMVVQKTRYLDWLDPHSRNQVLISADFLVCYLIAAVLLHPERGASSKLDAARWYSDQAV
jgi:hypothetical protein